MDFSLRGTDTCKCCQELNSESPCQHQQLNRFLRTQLDLNMPITLKCSATATRNRMFVWFSFVAILYEDISWEKGGACAKAIRGGKKKESK